MGRNCYQLVPIVFSLRAAVLKIRIRDGPAVRSGSKILRILKRRSKGPKLRLSNLSSPDHQKQDVA